MPNKVINPKDCPAGTRCLVNTSIFPMTSQCYAELTVLEWSAGGRVKVEWVGGVIEWPTTLPILVEVLPAVDNGD